MQTSYPLHFLLGLACSLGITLLAFEHYWPEKKPVVWDIEHVDAYEENEILPPIPEENGLIIKAKENVASEPQLEIPVEEIAESTPPKPKADKIYISDPPAVPIGGIQAITAYLRKNLKHPQEAINNKIEGIVFISFTVDTFGNLNQFKVARGIGYGCDQEAIRVMKNCPIKWEPPRWGGIAVPERLTMPIRFKLKDVIDATSTKEDIVEAPPVEQEEIITLVEDTAMPEGMKAFHRYIFKYVKKHWKGRLKPAHMHNKILVSFTVNREGELSDIKVLKSISKRFDKVIVQAIQHAPNWKPARARNPRPKKVTITLPFHFDLKR